jgi:hypothetical protein
MRNLLRLLDAVELSALDRLPVLIWLRTPPVDLIVAWGTEDFHPRRPIRKIATELLVDVEVPRRIGVEAGEDGLLVAACLP